jgi:hypothetical protein
VCAIYMTVVHRRFCGRQLASTRGGGTKGVVVVVARASVRRGGSVCLCIIRAVGDTRNKGRFVEIRYAS